MKHIFIIMFFLITSSFSNNLKKITLQLQWKYQFQFAGFIMAKEKGFYKDIGLDVNIKEYTQGINTIKDLLSNKTEYTMLNTPFIYKNKKIQKNCIISILLSKKPTCFCGTT